MTDPSALETAACGHVCAMGSGHPCILPADHPGSHQDKNWAYWLRDPKKLAPSPMTDPSALETAAPCPWCGNAEALFIAVSCVCCGRCGMEGPAAGTDPEAVSLWNNRAALDAEPVGELCALCIASGASGCTRCCAEPVGEVEPSYRALLMMWRVRQVKLPPGTSKSLTAIAHAAGRAERDAEVWRPIDTAPKDGTYILVARAHRMAVARWLIVEHPWWQGWTGLYPDNAPPSHWRPLPPPADGDQAGGGS